MSTLVTPARRPLDAPLIALVVVAAIAWFVLFSPWTAPHVPFWGVMAAATLVLSVASLVIDRASRARIYAFAPRHVAIGVGAALGLWLVFKLGHAAAVAILPFAQDQVGAIYATRAQASPLVIGALLLLWIGPAEEIFWRGFVQDRLTRRLGASRAMWLTLTLYVGVHLWAANLLLLGAAAICGLCWGWLYRRTGSLWPGLISHAIWDCLMFVVLPVA